MALREGGMNVLVLEPVPSDFGVLESGELDVGDTATHGISRTRGGRREREERTPSTCR